MTTKIMGLLCIATLTYSLHSMDTPDTDTEKKSSPHSLSVYVASPDSELFHPNPKPCDPPPTSPSDKLEMPKLGIIKYTIDQLRSLHNSPQTPKTSEMHGTWPPLHPTQSPHDPYAAQYRDCRTLAERIFELGLRADQENICTAP